MLPLEEHLCPICGTSMVSNPRYPRAVCADCGNSAADQSGRAVKFYNTDLSGGLTGRYTNGPLYDSADCWINGMACRAKEAYMGGVVIEILAV